MLIDKGLVFYIGCALIPTPPSPCYDFSLQFVAVIIIGIIAPKSVINPVTSLLFWLGRGCKVHLGKVPFLDVVVEKTDAGFQLWKKLLRKGTHPKNKCLRGLFSLIIKKDFTQRLIFGYFMTIFLGIILMGISLFLL